MIILINGYIGSGKDTVARITQYLYNYHTKTYRRPKYSEEGFREYIENEHYLSSTWEIHKFADKLKEIVALLLGVERNKLEDRVWREQPLGKQWWYYKTYNQDGTPRLISYNEVPNLIDEHYLVKLTPRLLLQLIGTEAGRQIIHPDIWVNATLSDYKGEYRGLPSEYDFDGDNKLTYPNWIITDNRFLNEYKSTRLIEPMTISVHVDRPLHVIYNLPFMSDEEVYLYLKEHNPELYKVVTHESERHINKLKNNSDVVLDNSKDISYLIEQINTKLMKLIFLDGNQRQTEKT